MPELDVRPFSQLLSDQAASAQAAAQRVGVTDGLLDFSEGSIFRALSEAFAGTALWLQAMFLQVLGMTRASTSQGADLDSWVGDYGLTRASPQPASGEVTFGRYSPGLPARIPAGALVRTGDGTRLFEVVADLESPVWDADLNGYMMPGGDATLTLPVRAIQPGVSGNVSPGAIQLIGSPIPGVDTVTNALAMAGGTDAETDSSLRQRFVAYISSLSRATPQAVGFAISQVQSGLTYQIIENQNPDTTEREAFFRVIVDDGTGDPSPLLLANVAAAVEAYRPLGVTFSVAGPQRVLADVSMSIVTVADADHELVVGQVIVALTDYINALPLGVGLPYTRLAQIAYATSPLVANVQSVLLNNGVVDQPGSPGRAIRAGTINVL